MGQKRKRKYIQRGAIEKRRRKSKEASFWETRVLPVGHQAQLLSFPTVGVLGKSWFLEIHCLKEGQQGLLWLDDLH